ncbi:hypothetical protein M3212_11295 [Alkalihalobacillus oceani]|uniref:hypothetical protein n=1 Tax=Halalkalibacter oceani TaxID=1653776 RepID=UPI00203C2773|nr:hypothetical protein [Halalkalibacter oceani]MCM3761368.1 hypothetical protein [Halalkalibacter oceani]
MSDRNKIAQLLYWIGITVIIVGIILAFTVAGPGLGNGEEGPWRIFIIMFLSAIVSGMILIGLGELIERQSEMNRLLRQGFQLAVPQNDPAITDPKIEIKNDQVDWNIEVEDVDKILQLFDKRKVREIIATPSSYTFVVVADDKEQLVKKVRSNNSEEILLLTFSSYPNLQEWYRNYKKEVVIEV